MRTHRRYPFLPASNLGWTPYAWLIYLSFFFIEPVFADVPPWEIAATAAVTAVFLPLYFWGFWQCGWRVLLPVTAIALLGTVAAPWNPGAAVFFIYASGYLGAAGPPKRGMALLAGLLAWLAAVTVVFRLGPGFWLVGLVFSVLVAGINIHFSEVARRDAALRHSREEVQRLARVAERERIGRDLHDLLGHTLSLITLKAELAGKLLDQADGTAAGREVADIERISRRALGEVREAVQGIRAGGLAAELDRAAATLDTAGIDCRRRVEPAALAAAGGDEERERALSFVLREAVTNVVRHAGAGRCWITLAREDGELRLTVRDDGNGGEAAEGFGLAGMRERLAALGGRLERRGGDGTRLTAALGTEVGTEVETEVETETEARAGAGA